MKKARWIFGGMALLTLLVAPCLWDGISNQAEAADGKGIGKGKVAPKFMLDPFWPKPLPHNYFMGVPGGIFVDSLDHVWVNQRAGTLADRDRGPTYTPPLSTCCYPAPAVMEFDEHG